MAVKKTFLNKVINMRRQAKETVDQISDPREDLSRDDILKMFHELRLHQIELKMQNEELRLVQRNWMPPGRAILISTTWRRWGIDS